MPISRKLTPEEVLERLPCRLEKRMESLQRLKLAGFEIVISKIRKIRDEIAPK